MGRAGYAEQLFTDGRSCSQAVFVPFAVERGIDEVDALKLAAGLGGGLRLGSTCGAITGALLALGLHHGDADDAVGRARVAPAVDAFLASFLERVGATGCPDILGCDCRTAEGKAVIEQQGLRQSRCLPAVGVAARTLEEML